MTESGRMDENRQFTDEQVRALVQLARHAPSLVDLVETQQRLSWAMRWLRNISIWVTGLVISWVAFGEAIRKALGLQQ